MAGRLVALSFCSRLSAKPAVSGLAFRKAAFSTSVRQAQNDASRRAARIGVKPTTWREKLMAPVGDNAYGIGKGFVAAASAVGIGALCFYTVTGSSDAVRENAMMWPKYVRDRVKSTYVYFGGSLLVTAASAAAVFRTPALLRLAASNSIPAILGSVALMIGSGMVCRSIPYTEGFGGKQVAWLVHSGLIGAFVAPICLLGGPVVLRAAWYTAGLVGGLSAIAVCAPSDQFLRMQAPLAMGLGVVFMSSLASAFLPPTTMLGASLYSVAVYGGVVLFAGLLMYDTQKLIKVAENHPPDHLYSDVQRFDPINSSVGIYLDTVNLFIRIALILSGNGKKKK